MPDNAGDVPFEAMLDEARELDANAFQAELCREPQAPGAFEAVMGGLETPDEHGQGETVAPQPAADAAGETDDHQVADTVVAAAAAEREQAADIGETAEVTQLEEVGEPLQDGDAAEIIESEDAVEAEDR